MSFEIMIFSKCVYKVHDNNYLNRLLKARIALKVPQPILNGVLLKFPILYKSKFINYESYLGDCIEELLEKLDSVFGIEGNLIECGCARCGSTVIMAKHLKEKSVNKKIYACDLFGGGFDMDELVVERELGLTAAPNNAFTYNSYEYVQKKIKSLGLSDYIIPIKGLLRDTLPQIDYRFCFCLIDCDLRKSISFSAENLWPKLTSKGLMLFDDYKEAQYKGAKLAVDAFVSKYENSIAEHGLLKRLYFVRKK